MPTSIFDRSPSAHESPGTCLAAPAVGGQRVGTLDGADQEDFYALQVLIKMRRCQAYDSPEYEALLHACAILQSRLEMKGVPV